MIDRLLENVKDDCTETSVSLQGHLLIVSSRVQGISGKGPSVSDRDKISGFSASSATRMRRYLRSSSAEYTHFITLTYIAGNGKDGRVCKEHLRRMVQELKRRSVRPNWSAFWFLEFQNNSNIHFHIFTTEFYAKDWIASTWYRICGSEDKRHLHAGTRIEKFISGRHGVSSYATKYAAKQQQKDVPEEFGWVGRFWGVSGERTTKEASLRYINASNLSNAAKRKIDALREAIISDVRDRKCEVMRTKTEGVVVYVYKSIADTQKVRRAILVAVISSTLYDNKSRLYPHYTYEELMTDITNDGDK